MFEVKRIIVRYLLEPWISEQRAIDYVIFLGRLVFRLRKPFVIAVTGSVGKSTTVGMIADVLSQPDARPVVGPVRQTLENMNDNLGLGATLLLFREFVESPGTYLRMFKLLAEASWRAFRAVTGRYPKVLVLECGVGSTASLRRQAEIAPPNLAVVTKIGPAHLELLKTIEGVVLEKGALVRAVPPDGLVILGVGHDYVAQLEAMASAPVVKVGGNDLELSRNITRAACRHMGVPGDVVEAGLRDFKMPEGRLTRMDFNSMTVIDDSWNANPMSMKLGLDVLAELSQPGQRRVAILGHMAELGDEGARYHEEVGIYARTRADLVIGVGELSRLYKPDLWFDNIDACAAQIEALLHRGDLLLVKGSHSSRLGHLVTRLQAIAETRRDSAGQT